MQKKISYTSFRKDKAPYYLQNLYYKTWKKEDFLQKKKKIFHFSFRVVVQVEGEMSGNDHPVQAVEVMEQSGLVVCGTSVNVLKTAHITEDFIDDVESQDILA